MHYLLKCVRYKEESIYWKLVKRQSNALNKKIKSKSANQSVEGTDACSQILRGLVGYAGSISFDCRATAHRL